MACAIQPCTFGAKATVVFAGDAYHIVFCMFVVTLICYCLVQYRGVARISARGGLIQNALMPLYIARYVTAHHRGPGA